MYLGYWISVLFVKETSSLPCRKDDHWNIFMRMENKRTPVTTETRYISLMASQQGFFWAEELLWFGVSSF
jgi:hypothetical protein